jgi:hypothetical protein
MRIEVHQRGGVLGLDRLYLVIDATIEVIDKGRSRGARDLDPDAAERIGALAASAVQAEPARTAAPPVSDAMETDIAIQAGAGEPRRLSVRTGDDAPDVVWALIGEIGRASRS